VKIPLALQLTGLMLLVTPQLGSAQTDRQPVIDMHMHAYEGELKVPNPNTGEILSHNGEEHLRDSLRFMEDHHVVLGAISANTELETASRLLAAWEREAGERVLKGLFFGKKAGYLPVDQVRSLVTAGEIDFLGEMGFQYDGRSPSDPDLFGYYALAQELDVPVAIHTGMSAPGTPLRCCPEFRLSLGNPYLLEDVLVSFPRLRIWAMHAGGQFFNEMVTMMTMYPRLYVDISPYTWLDAGNAELLDRFLRLAKEQEVLDRVLFGSDQMRWPETIGTAIQRVKGLDYLTDQEKAAILYDNAARFLRLSEDQIARHHGN
jgi:predicted TIM-barrel fold metal-dependent hydrolase